jgi:adenosine kinase
MSKMRGGVAGNIAYNLALLGEQPLIMATAGQDFGEYRTSLEEHGVDTSGILIIENEFTSSCFINTDQADNQIVAFYAGAMSRACDVSLKTVGIGTDDLVLISPSDSISMYQLALECQELGIPYIFDPGKQTPRMEAEHIRAGLQHARVLVGNDYEFAMMAKKLETTEEALIQSAPLTFVTRGEQGSTIYHNSDGTTFDIPVATPQEVLDPTGAGDAYLAGIACGLAHELPLDVVGRVAALAAVFAIEHRGCQEHCYTRSAFAARYAATFGTNDVINTLFAAA